MRIDIHKRFNSQQDSFRYLYMHVYIYISFASSERFKVDRRCIYLRFCLNRERASEIIYSQTGSTKSSMVVRCWLRGGTAQQQSAEYIDIYVHMYIYILSKSR